MKKLILTTVSALALLTASAEDGVKFKISGTLPDTVKTVVVIENGNQKAPVAQGEVKNGKFTIEGSAEKRHTRHRLQRPTKNALRLCTQRR